MTLLQNMTYENLFWTVDLATGRFCVSQALALMLGEPLDELDQFCERLEPLSAHRLRFWIEEASHEPEPGEIPIAFRDIQPTHYLGQLQPLFHQGRISGITCHLMPILSLIQETAIQESYPLQSAYQHAGMGIVISDPHDRILECNPAFCQLIGLPEAKLKGRRLYDLTHEADRKRELPLQEQLRHGDNETMHLENRYLREDGTYFWAEVAVMLIRDAYGEISQYVRFVLNLSERKQLEAELALRRRLMTDLFEYAPILMGILGIEGDDYRFVMTNPAMETYVAPQYSALQGRTAREVGIPEPTRQFFLGQLRDCLEREQAIQFLHDYRRPNGTEKSLHCTFIPVAEPGGQLQQAYFVFHDLSEIRATQHALAAERAVLEALVTNLADFIFVQDAQGLFLRVWTRQPDQLLVTSESMIGQSPQAFFPEWICEQYAQAFRVAHERQAPVTFEHASPNPGDPRQFQTKVLPFVYQGQNCVIVMSWLLESKH